MDRDVLIEIARQAGAACREKQAALPGGAALRGLGSRAFGALGRGLGQAFRGAVRPAGTARVMTTDSYEAMRQGFFNRARQRAAQMGSVAVGGAQAAAPAAAARPRFSPRRVAGALGAVGGTAGVGALGYGHARNALTDYYMDPYQRFTHNQQLYSEAARPLLDRMDHAIEHADAPETSTQSWLGGWNPFATPSDVGPDAVNRLQAQLDSGDFGASPFSFGGLNPFARRSAGYYLGQARAAQTAAQKQFEAETNKTEAARQRFDPARLQAQYDALSRRANQALMPEQQAGLQRQMAWIRRMQEAAPPPGLGTEAASILQKMRASGMGDPYGYIEEEPAGPPPAGPPPVPPSAPPPMFAFPPVQAPQAPAPAPAPPLTDEQAQRWAINPTDYLVRPRL